MMREKITAHLKSVLEPLDYVHAFWCEGADANGSTDIYSDIDYYIEVEDEHLEASYQVVENALNDIGTIDYKYVMSHGHPKLEQRIYHIEGTSEFLMIDFVWQLSSRDRNEILLIEGDTIENAKVIFDKKKVIQYKTYNLQEDQDFFRKTLDECRYRYSQHCRAIKYVYRKKYPEAYAYYNRYVIEPLIMMLRMIHTPAHVGYYLVHISDHLPEKELIQLEQLLRVSSLSEIEENIKVAQNWFRALEEKVVDHVI